MIKLRVLDIIKEVGPVTSREVAEQTGWSHSFARAAVSYCNKEKLIHICEWRRDEDGGRLYPRPVYNIGNRKNAQRIKPLTATEYRKRYKQAKKNMVPDIFSAAVPVDERRLTPRKRPDVSARFKERKNGKVAPNTSGT